MSEDDIYWNIGEEVIVIVVGIFADPLGGPGRAEVSYMIEPGQGINLSCVGLSKIKHKYLSAEAARGRIKMALSTPTGQAALEELRALRDVAEALRERPCTCPVISKYDSSVCRRCETIARLDKIREGG